MKNKENITDCLILFFLTIGFFWRVIFENKFLFFSKSLISAYERMYTISVSAKSFFSVVKAFDLSIFYPANLFTSLLIRFTHEVDLGFRFFEICFVAHFFLVAIFTYLLIKYGLRLSRYASLFGAIGFSFAGIFVTHILNFSFYFSLTWLPLIFLLYLKGFEKNRIRYLVLGGLIMGASVLSGSAYGIFYTSLVILAFFAYEAIFNKQIRISDLIGKTFMILFIGWFIGVVFILVDYFYNAIPIFREVFYVSVPKLISFYKPILFPNSYPFSENWWEINIYLGMSTLILAFASFVFLKERKQIRFFAFNFLIFTSLLLLVSKEGSFLDYYFKIFPNLDFFNFPTRMRVLSNFSLIVMSCFCIDALYNQLNRNKTKILKTYITLLAICVIVCMSILLPMHYVNEILSLDSSFKAAFSVYGPRKFIQMNIFFWLLLITIMSLAVFGLVLAKKSKKLIIGLIFLLVLDIFTYWSNLNPISYRYGDKWEMKPPSEYGIGVNKNNE
ncbi:hypothetical protein ACFL2Y_02375 [Candidatus Omnitrophota bacterium]